MYRNRGSLERWGVIAQKAADKASISASQDNHNIADGNLTVCTPAYSLYVTLEKGN